MESPQPPVEIAPRVWWVGQKLPGDRFQCHVYLVEQGEQSVLIDPGSALTAGVVASNIESVVGLGNVRWVVCSHADPDIIAAIPTLVGRGLRDDASLVTHWRDAALIRHMGWYLPFWLVEEHGWELTLEDRTLRFLFTPYAHFAGAFCTFDEATGTLFSSDLFGAFTEDQALMATSLACIDGMRAFHEHYMPSREALNHGLDQLEGLAVRLLAPQHGQLLPERLVAPVVEALRDTECGLYLFSQGDPGLAFLFNAARATREVTRAVVDSADLAEVAARLKVLGREFLGLAELSFWSRWDDGFVLFDADDQYAGVVAEPDASVVSCFDTREVQWSEDLIALPLGFNGIVTGVAALRLHRPIPADRRIAALLLELASLVGTAVQRQSVRRAAELGREELYRRATQDALTGLHNRMYFDEIAHQYCARDSRAASPALAALMVDIDLFKKVNDRYGHATGDAVLRAVAHALRDAVRDGDVTVRFGGEEFLALLVDVDEVSAAAVGERVRTAAREASTNPAVTVSIGVAMHHQDESCEAFVGRADLALYEAKREGRDRVRIAV